MLHRPMPNVELRMSPRLIRFYINIVLNFKGEQILHFMDDFIADRSFRIDVVACLNLIAFPQRNQVEKLPMGER